jgi:transglutaminase-like putative cysteine protease
MPLYSIRHETKYQFEQPPQQAIQHLHLTPKSGPGQIVKKWDINLQGADIAFESGDHHGNIVHIAVQRSAQTTVVITATGDVETNDTSGIFGEHDNMLPLQHFRRNSAYCSAGPTLKKIARNMPADDNELNFLHSLSAFVAKNVRYERGHTDSSSTAEEAFQMGFGVCQDHVHVFLALARHAGIAARYVSGYLMEPGFADIAASHAWAEAYVNELGWVGFDISNAMSPNANYVRLASGFDYSDIQPVAGLRFGEGAEKMSAKVTIQ